MYDPELELESQIRALDSALTELKATAAVCDPVVVLTCIIEKKVRELAALNGTTVRRRTA